MFTSVFRFPSSVFRSEKTSFASNTSGIFAVRLRSRLVCLSENRIQNAEYRKACPSVFRVPCSVVRTTGCASSLRCQVVRRRKTENRERIVLGPAAASLEDRASRRAIQLSRETTIFKLYISSECQSHFSVFRTPSSVLRNWWSWTGSNRRPHACKARALPTELQPRRRTEYRKPNNHPYSVFCIPSSEPGGPGRT